MHDEELQRWVGREQVADDEAVTRPVTGLAALLDHAQPPWIAGELPPLAHWLYFLPHARQSLLDTDGHPRRGDFLPPVPLPRRMWVGSRIRFEAPIPLGSAMRRHSTISSIVSKEGRMGALVFVTVKHEIRVATRTAVTEEQDIVYRAAPSRDAVNEAAAPSAVRVAQATRRFMPDATQLFRFSALTFNAHRIHYDRNYAREVEGYAGLVVHGPFVAILLMDHFLRQAPLARVQEFSFRAERPLLDTSPIDLCLSSVDQRTDLWAQAAGSTAFSAKIIEQRS